MASFRRCTSVVSHSASSHSAGAAAVLGRPQVEVSNTARINRAALTFGFGARTSALLTVGFLGSSVQSGRHLVRAASLGDLVEDLRVPAPEQISQGEPLKRPAIYKSKKEFAWQMGSNKDISHLKFLFRISSLSGGVLAWVGCAPDSYARELRPDLIYETGELFELGIQLSYLLILLGLLGVGTFFVIRQVLIRRELDLSAKELQEQVRSGDASATEYFELGAVMLRRKFYPAATKYLQQAIENWDGDDQDLAQVYNALGVSYTRDGKLEKGISQFETAVKLQPGYVTAWNNLGDAYEKKKDLKAALKAFEEVLLFDPNNKLARPRREALKERVQLYRGVSIKSDQR